MDLYKNLYKSYALAYSELTCADTETISDKSCQLRVNVQRMIKSNGILLSSVKQQYLVERKGL